MSRSAYTTGIVPAALSFLVIYNPHLGKSGDSTSEQIVYYFDGKSHGAASSGKSDSNSHEADRETENKRLRVVGLAQGMVQFSRDFTNGEKVDCIETEKSRQIIHNLEGDWWLSASVDLTRLEKQQDSTASELKKSTVEYSAREVSPPALLLQQLLRANDIFLLHHGLTLEDFWRSTTHDQFCLCLRVFWDSFLASWDILLHGNPATDIYNGLKLSAGGELGVGVGEEEWGSGEREVLEDFMQRTDGLVDLVVSRFDHMHSFNGLVESRTLGREDSNLKSRLSPSDGIVFTGRGAITRSSVKSISAWMEWIANTGAATFGVLEKPGNKRRRRRARSEKQQGESTKAIKSSLDRQGNPVHLPPPVIASKDPQRRHEAAKKGAGSISGTTKASSDDSVLTTEVLKYLTLGVYGSSWGFSAGQGDSARRGQTTSASELDQTSHVPRLRGPTGQFLIGLLGDLEDELGEQHDSKEVHDDPEPDFNSRLSMRHVFVECMGPPEKREGHSTEQLTDPRPAAERLRVVVYVQGPFLFSFLFRAQTESLSLPMFYRSLHHQLGPLRTPLLKSTDPGRVALRIREAAKARSPTLMARPHPIHDLVHDPIRLTLHNTIPNIPEPLTDQNDLLRYWSRMEALSVHSQVVNVYTSTRRRAAELERTCKTSRGWWIVWLRVPNQVDEGGGANGPLREAFLIRKTHTGGPRSKASSSSLTFGFARGEGGKGRESHLAGAGDGLGVDARPYVDELLGLCR